MMTVHEAAITLNKSESTIYAWIRAGKIHAQEQNGVLVIHRSAIGKLLR